MAVTIYYPGGEESRRQPSGWTGDQTTFGPSRGQVREAKVDGQEPIRVCPTCGQVISEVAPPGWEGTVQAMKKHKDIVNPWALAWYMKGRGDRPRREVEVAEARALQERMRGVMCARCAEKAGRPVRESGPSPTHAVQERSPRASNGHGMMQYRRAREQASAQDVRAYSRYSGQNITEAQIEAEHRSLVSVGRIPKMLRTLSEEALRQHHEAHMRYIAAYGRLLGERRLEELLKHCDELAGLAKEMREQQEEIGTASLAPVAPERRTVAQQAAAGPRGQHYGEAVAHPDHQDRIDDLEDEGHEILTVHGHDDEGTTHARVKTPDGRVTTKELPRQKERQAGGQFLAGRPGPAAPGPSVPADEQPWLGSGTKREVSQTQVTDAPLRYRGIAIEPSSYEPPGLERRPYYEDEQLARRDGDAYWTDRALANEKWQR